MLKVHIRPSFDVDRTGGVARVVEAQLRYLPEFDIEIVDDVAAAQVFVGHAGDWSTRDDIPRVAYSHGIYWSDQQYSWPKWAQVRNADIARCFVEADAIITPVEWVANIIRRDMWAPVFVMPNGIDEDLLNKAITTNRSKSYVYWNKARVDAVCEIDSLVALAERAPDVGFITHAPPVRGVPNIKTLGIKPYSEAIDIMRKAGVYLATTREVFGVSVLEAMALGVPVLGYRFGGQRDQLEAVEGDIRRGGILVQPGDIHALHNGLNILRNPVVWREMSEQAREQVRKHYLWRTIMEQQAAFLHDLHANWGGQSGPEISVVIPNHNLGKFLPDAVASALVQVDAPPYEVIVVDDASSDPDTKEVVRKIEARDGPYANVTLLRHQTNCYLAETLNTGITAARGRWILNLDADNMLPPRALHDLWRAVGKNPGLDVVYGRMQVISETGEVQAQFGPNGMSAWPPQTFDYAGQLSHENQVHSSALFRRRMWERAGGYRQFTRYVEWHGTAPMNVRLNSDAEFWTRCAALGFRFGGVVNTPTLIYRNLPTSMSHTVPEWDWHEVAPKASQPHLGAPGGRVLTHEPLEVSVVVNGGTDHRVTVESLWPQTYDRWDVHTGTHCEPLPSYVKDGWLQPSGLYLVYVKAGHRLRPYALEELLYAYRALTARRPQEHISRPLVVAEQRSGTYIVRRDALSQHNRSLEELAEVCCIVDLGASNPITYWDFIKPELVEAAVAAPCRTCGGGMARTFRPNLPGRQMGATASYHSTFLSSSSFPPGERVWVLYIGTPAVKTIISKNVRVNGEQLRYVWSKFQGERARYQHVYMQDLQRILGFNAHFRLASADEIASITEPSIPIEEEAYA